MLKLLLRLSFFLLWKIAPYLRLLFLQLLAHAIDKQPTLNFTFNRCPGNQWLQNKEPCACTPSPSTHKLAPFRQSSRLSLETSREMSHKRFYVKLDLQLHAVGGGTGGFPMISTLFILPAYLSRRVALLARFFGGHRQDLGLLLSNWSDGAAVSYAVPRPIHHGGIFQECWMLGGYAPAAES